MGAWSLSLDGDLDPSTGVKWVGLVCAWGTSEACVLGYPAGIYWFANHRFYVSSIGAYIELLANELMMTANKIEYKTHV